MDSSFNQQNNLGIMDDQQVYVDDLDSISSSSDISTASTLSDLMEDATSSSLSLSSSSSSDDHHELDSSSSNGPLYEMSSLIQQLPFKRGLSKHYQGKSQSFTSLSEVRCLEDLAKPENPYKKKLKTCKSYGGLFLDHHQTSTHKDKAAANSSTINKSTCYSSGRSTRTNIISSSKHKAASSRGSYSSSSSTLKNAKRSSSSNSLSHNRPPIPPQKTSTCLSNHQTPLFV
ncbi:hypothetical protein BVC80_1489g5 [Macleaya cordata]|uniref:Oxidative stress 3 n=1 Tax=Macleaya cordata TaxID=56857 RepID=A0A200QNM0_MACCD|nr:hypothetical protein BVC80_1489g5 [Macleaya cordata]